MLVISMNQIDLTEPDQAPSEEIDANQVILIKKKNLNLSEVSATLMIGRMTKKKKKINTWLTTQR